MSENNLTRDEAAERAGLVRDVSYDVALDLTGDGETFRSTTRVRFSCASPGASTFLDLVADEVESVEAPGGAVPKYDFDGNRLWIHGLASTNDVSVVARCRYMSTGSGLHRFVDPVDAKPYLHTQFEPFDAHRVLACFDQPDIKAPWTLEVVAPPDWAVVSNSLAVEVGDGRWRFGATKRLSTYLYAVVAGPYHVVPAEHKGLPLALYCRQSLAKHLDTDELLDVTRRGLDWFTEQYDYPYPFEKYDQLFVPEFSAGAMENAGCVTFNENYVFRSKVTEAQLEGRASTILHEMAHMWFGDLVTMRWWDDLWLNESFATYMATASIVAATRFTGGWARFAAGTKTAAYAQDQLPSTHPISADIVDTEATRTHFDAITYQKGASVLRQLVAWVGEDAFRDGVRAYFKRHEWDNAGLGDFLRALQEASGRDLAAWSREWLETAGVNTLRPEIDGGLEIVQEGQPGHDTLRSHRVAVGLYELRDGTITRRDRVELDVTGARTRVPEVTVPLPDLVLLNDDDLTYAKIRLDPRSLDTVVAHLGSIEDQLARSLCWAAAWEMVRDAELPTARYVELVASHAHRETDLGTVGRLLGQASMAVNSYGDPSRRDAYRASVAQRARTQMDGASAGGDAQLTWARSWISHDDSPDALAQVAGLLDGSRRIDGLDVDTDLRWHIVESLLSRGRAGSELADAEAERDPTDIGRRRALAASASRPDADGKAQAWQMLMEDVSLPLATVRAVAAAFHQPAQDELLRGYVERYFAALPGLWSERDRDVALALTRALFPSTLIDPAVVAATQRALDGLNLTAQARRVLAESQDRMQRALRARAADSAA